MKYEGRAWKFGDNVDTDMIIAARYCNVSDGAALAKHVFADGRPEFASSVSAGDVVVGGRNFGCGSSREHAPIALSGGGVRFIIARSFARIFYRNAINVGLLPLVCSDADEIADGADLVVHMNEGYVESGRKKYAIEPVPGFLKEIVDSGGLVDYARNLEEVETCTGSRS